MATKGARDSDLRIVASVGGLLALAAKRRGVPEAQPSPGTIGSP